MVDSNRHEQRRLRTRKKLLEAAKKVISANGFADTTILDITDAADVSKRTFYVHFPRGKEEVLTELAQYSVDELVAVIRDSEVQRADLSMYDSMRAAMTIVFQWMEDHRALAQIMYGPDAEPTLRTLIIDYTARVFVQEMETKDCSFRENAVVPIEIVGQIKAATLAQLVQWSLTRPNEYTPAQLAGFMVAIFFEPFAALYPETARDDIGGGWVKYDEQ